MDLSMLNGINAMMNMSKQVTPQNKGTQSVEVLINIEKRHIEYFSKLIEQNEMLIEQNNKIIELLSSR